MMSDHLVSWLKHRTLVLESLENRDLLSGFRSVMMHPVVDQIPAIVSIQSGLLSKASSMTSSTRGETRVVATLTPAAGSQISGTTTFSTRIENGVTKKELSVQIKGAVAGSIVDVSITDPSNSTATAIGKFTVGNDGTAQFKAKTGLPDVAATWAITLSTTASDTTTTLANGTFAVSTTNPPGTHERCGEGTETHLAASISDTTIGSTLTGSASYENETKHGKVVNELVVRLKGGKAGDVIDVSVATDSTSLSKSLGTITVGADGTGVRKLKTNVPTLTTNSIIALTMTVGGTPQATPFTSAAFAATTRTMTKTTTK